MSDGKLRLIIEWPVDQPRTILYDDKTSFFKGFTLSEANITTRLAGIPENDKKLVEKIMLQNNLISTLGGVEPQGGGMSVLIEDIFVDLSLSSIFARITEAKIKGDPFVDLREVTGSQRLKNRVAEIKASLRL